MTFFPWKVSSINLHDDSEFKNGDSEKYSVSVERYTHNKLWRSRKPPALFFMFGSRSFTELPYFSWRLSIPTMIARTNTRSNFFRIVLKTASAYSSRNGTPPQTNLLSKIEAHESISVSYKFTQS